MQQIGSDKSKTLDAWANIVIQIWKRNITELRVYDTGELYDSFLQTLLYNAGNSASKIEFSFALHGAFVDAGVGGEISKGNGGDLGFTPLRKAKPWKKPLYGQLLRLRDIMREKFAEDTVNVIVFPLNNYSNGR